MAKKSNPITTKPDGTATWVQKAGDQYDVTGVDRSGKRFSMRYCSWMHASGINLWQGSRWLLRDSKRHLISRVYN